MTETRTFKVDGMSCGHCRESVIDELSDLNGVTEVEVQLESGQVSVRGDGFSDEEVRNAVAEAGYAVTGRA
ncbi:MAG: heavy-metal-associated domain-containing protein [Solirubrobacterales bacterium]